MRIENNLKGYYETAKIKLCQYVRLLKSPSFDIANIIVLLSRVGPRMIISISRCFSSVSH